MRKNKTSKHHLISAPVTAAIEAMERRTLLSGAVFSGHTLTVTGSPAADVIDVNYTNVTNNKPEIFDITTTINGSKQTFTNVSMQSLVVNALDGNNIVSVEGFGSDGVADSINAGAGNDTITTNISTQTQDTGISLRINAGDGNNVVDAAFNGHATINGGSGNDSLTAETSFSELPAYATINGGDGNDTITAGANGNAIVTAYGQGGNDMFAIKDYSDTLAAYGGAGNNTLDLSGYQPLPSANTLITLDGVTHGALAVGADIQNVIGGFDGNLTVVADNGLNDNIAVSDLEGVVSLVGGSGSDTLSAGNTADLNFAGATAYLRGGSGNSLLIPGSGVTHFSNGTGTATADFSAATADLQIYLDGSQYSGDPNATAFDYANGGVQVNGPFDTFDGTVQNAIGGSGNDLIEGTGGNNILTGGPGNDTLVSNGGNDALFGDAGDDTFQARDAASTYIDGGAGNNTAFTDAFDTTYNMQNRNTDLATPTQLTGTIIGTPGSYHNDGNTIAKVFDGNVATYFDAPTASGNFVGLDLGTPQVVNQISFAPRAGWESRMAGGRIQGSNSPAFSNAATLYTIGFTPASGAPTTVGFANTTAYRYIRYIGPANSFCNIAELKLFNTTQPLIAEDSHGNLVINGTSGNDNITVNFYTSTESSNYHPTPQTTFNYVYETFTVTLNGHAETLNNSSIRQIVVNTGNGNDTVDVEGFADNQGGTGGADTVLPFVNIDVTAGDSNDSVYTRLGHDEYGQIVNGDSVTITAGNGNDSLTAFGGEDQTIVAGNGNDTLESDATYGPSGCAMIAGNGNDSFTAGSAGDGGDEIGVTAGTGRDTIFNSDYEDNAGFSANGGPGVGVSWRNQTAAIAGTVFIDTSGSGQYEPGDPVVPGAQIFLDNNNDGVYDAGDMLYTADSNGNYDIPNLMPGDAASTYQFGVLLPPGMSFDSPTDGLFTVQLAFGTGVTGYDFAIKPLKPLAGKVIGTTGSYNNVGNTAARAFDGNLNTFFDAPTASGSWAGLDLGSAQIITQISYAPRSGWANRMVGGMFQGSNSADFSSGVVTLYTVTAAPAQDVLTTVAITNLSACRYVRYIGPANSYCNIAEAQFFGNAPPFATVSNGSLVVTGTEGTDTISVTFNVDQEAAGFTGNYAVEENGQTLNFNAAGIDTVVIDSLDGNDSISVNGQESYDVESATSVNLVINSGSGNDTFNLYRDDGPVSGGGNGSASITLTAGDGNDSVAITGGAFVNVTLGNGSDSLITTATSSRLIATETLGNGNDSVIAGDAGDGGQLVTVTAGSGEDSFLNGDPDDEMTADGITLSDFTCTLTGSVLSTVPNDQSGAMATVSLTNNGVDASYNSSQSVAIGGTYTFSGLPSPNQQGGEPVPTFTITITPPAGYTVAQPSAQTYQETGNLTTGYNFLLTPTTVPLTGTVIGTAGSYRNEGNTAAKAFDGNLTTFFDAPTASGSWAGLDLGSAQIITQISYAPRSGWANRMVGGMFQASNSADFSSGVVTLYTVTSTPAAGVLTSVSVANWSAYRYVRYIGPANGYCNIAEAQFFGIIPATGASLEPDGTLVVNGSDGADNIHVALNVEGNNIATTVAINQASQIFTADFSGLVVNAGAGNDTVLIDGTDDSSAILSAIPITVNGGDGDDNITTQVTYGDYGAVSIHLDGGAGDDLLNVQNDGYATLIGGDGNDVFKSNGNPEGLLEAVYGGNGNDTVVADDYTGYSIYDAGAGSNTIDYFTDSFDPLIRTLDLKSGFTKNVNNALVSGNIGRVICNDNGDTITYPAAGSNDASVQGGAGDDIITVHGARNVTVNGGGGNDIISVRGNTLEQVDGGSGYNIAYADPGAIVTNIQSLNPDIKTKLTGTAIGTAGSYRNHGTTIANAFDGNLATFFDAPDASGDWVGLDLGSAQVVTQVEYAPRAGWESRMIGGEIQAGNTADFSSGVVTLHTITSAPTAGVLTTVSLSNTTAYRYYRYVGPANSYCDIAELEFDG